MSLEGDAPVEESPIASAADPEDPVTEEPVNGSETQSGENQGD